MARSVACESRLSLGERWKWAMGEVCIESSTLFSISLTLGQCNPLDCGRSHAATSALFSPNLTQGAAEREVLPVPRMMRRCRAWRKPADQDVRHSAIMQDDVLGEAQHRRACHIVASRQFIVTRTVACKQARMLAAAMMKEPLPQACSMTSNVSPAATGCPLRQRMLRMVPLMGAEMQSSVFIASRITTASPASTDWPSSTSTFQTLP